MPFCTNCGNEEEAGSVFCTQCGASMVADTHNGTLPTETAVFSNATQSAPNQQVVSSVFPSSTQQMPVQSTPAMHYVGNDPIGQVANDQNGKSKKILIAIIIVAVIAIAAVAVFFVLKFTSGSSSSSTTPQTPVQVQPEGNSSSGTSQQEKSDASTSSESKSNKDYILPDSNSRYLTESDLSALTDYELYLARNEIFARHGRGFKNSDLANWFSSKSWYTRIYSPEQFDSMESPLNAYEKKNSQLILELEKRRNSPYLS